MPVSKKSLFQIISLLVIANGVVFALSPDSEPEWNLVEELGLFQASDNLVAGMIEKKIFLLLLNLFDLLTHFFLFLIFKK